MKRYFGYIRVSTPRQGRGVSLDEQRSAISAYAARHGFKIAEWFVETETAAKQGRTEYTKMIRGLESGKATGVIIHKIARGARNMYPQAIDFRSSAATRRRFAELCEALIGWTG